MARERTRWSLALLGLLALAAAADAQGGRRGQGRGNAQGGRNREPKESTWDAPKDRADREDKLPPMFLPGFDTPPGGGKHQKPVGPKPKANAPPKAQPPKPADPMKEADQVTGAADHRSQVEEAEAQLLQEHFLLCDLDASGWLSLREAELTLSLDRAAFRRMDQDQDGRLAPGEFAAQSALLLVRLGARPVTTKREETAEPPAGPPPEAALEPPPPATEEPPTPDPERATRSELEAMVVQPGALLGRYDLDGSGGIDASETEQLFGEAGLVLSGGLVQAQLDEDDSGQLEAGELVAIAWLVSRDVPEALRPPPPPEPEPAPELETAPVQAAAPAPPPAAPAPRWTHFARLDPGRDGFIDEGDLRALQSPSRLDLRFRALLSAVDQDGDGRLSEAEFRASMGVGPR